MTKGYTLIHKELLCALLNCNSKIILLSHSNRNIKSKTLGIRKVWDHHYYIISLASISSWILKYLSFCEHFFRYLEVNFINFGWHSYLLWTSVAEWGVPPWRGRGLTWCSGWGGRPWSPSSSWSGSGTGTWSWWPQHLRSWRNKKVNVATTTFFLGVQCWNELDFHW